MSDRLKQALAELGVHASPEERAKLARYGIPDGHAMGVAMRDIIALGKAFGRDHALANALWKDGRYEARSLAAFLGDPNQLASAEMDQWVAEFDNWAICDTVCFRLFDRSPLAWQKVDQWGASDRLYIRRAALALIWGLSVHDKTSPDTAFLDRLPVMEAAAHDPRDHVWKAASMALRATGKRSVALRRATLKIGDRLTRAPDKHAARVGREVCKALSG